jgi:hypothetical protein
MTVPVQNPFTSSIGNGVTTVFPYSFMIADEDDLKVVVDDVVQTTGYTVSGVGNPLGGDVTFAVAPANDLKVLRYLDPILWREIDYQQFGDFLADTVNLDFDKVWLALQALQQNFKRSLKLPVDTATDQTIAADATERANKYIGFDSLGNLALSSEVTAGALIVSSFIETLLDDLDETTARATLGVAIGSDVQAYDADIPTVAASQAEMEAGTEAALRSMSPLRVAQAIAAIGQDTVARDQIALTNMRLLINSSVTTGGLVQGKQWELGTDEWASSSTNETYTAATPNYYTGAVTEYTPTGSTFGDMTAASGLAASFDGSTNQVNGSCSGRIGVTSGYVGKAFASAQNIARVYTYGGSDVGYAHADNGSVTINIYGKNSSPANATDGTLLGTSGSFTDGVTTQQKQITCDATTAYQYVWAVINASSQNLYMAEVKYFTVSDVTLIPPASTSVSTAPTYMDAYLLYKDDSGSAVLGTDLTVELSRDGGTTYTAATITNLASYDGTYSIIKARADVSAQPSGTSMLCRIKMLNSKLQRVAAPALYAE